MTAACEGWEREGRKGEGQGGEGKLLVKVISHHGIKIYTQSCSDLFFSHDIKFNVKLLTADSSKLTASYHEIYLQEVEHPIFVNGTADMIVTSKPNAGSSSQKQNEVPDMLQHNELEVWSHKSSRITNKSDVKRESLAQVAVWTL